jgi:hypothetical protein
MPRITLDDVRALMPTTAATLPLLLIASRLVDRVFGASEVAPTTLADIELFLTLHLLTVRTPPVTQKKMGSTSVTTEHGLTGSGLQATVWGQMAVALDTAGLLAQVGLKRATIYVD